MKNLDPGAQAPQDFLWLRFQKEPPLINLQVQLWVIAKICLAKAPGDRVGLLESSYVGSGVEFFDLCGSFPALNDSLISWECPGCYRSEDARCELPLSASKPIWIWKMSAGIMGSAAGAGRTNTLSAASRPWDTREQQGRESSARGTQGAEDEPGPIPAFWVLLGF